VINPDPDPADLVAGHLADQLAVLEQRISSANVPGSLDGLFAYHVLQNTVVSSFTWEISPVTDRWLEQNEDRLTNAPQLAALGYGLTHFGKDNGNKAKTRLAAGLRQLMRRDPYPPDGVTFLHDPRQLIGIALAAVVVHDELPQMGDWLRGVIEDIRLRADAARQDLIRRHVRGTLTDEASVLGSVTDIGDVAHLALLHWMTAVGTTRLPDPAVDLKVIQRGILSGLLRTRAIDLSVPDAALLRAAAGHIIDATIDSAVLNRSHIGVVLRRFTPAMRRWRWDDPAKVKDPIRWPINSEREVQDIIWALLRAVFDDLGDEEPLRKVGHSSYRSDFGLPRLGVLVEIKYVRSAAEFKKVEKEVYEDSVAYLKDRATYKKIVVFIYDASASVQEHATTIDALLDVEHVIDVIIVSRPSQLPAPGTEMTGPIGIPAKRRRTSKTPR
jgi:hypothetical protein